jgi:hypothetical protein
MMRRFRTRDLMINILPEGPGFREMLRPGSCEDVCITLACMPCSLQSCGGDWPTRCHPAVTRFGGFGQPEDLAVLKAQLRQALAQVEAQERVQSEMMRPQTLDEASALEEKLEAALEEVQARKEELQEGAEDQG